MFDTSFLILDINVELFDFDADPMHLFTLLGYFKRIVAGAGNCPLQQCFDILDLFLLPTGKALPAEVQCLLHNDHAPIPKARIWKVSH